jgi:hypothetical protein
MRRISSTLTFYYKRVFPVIWFGGLVLIGGIGLYAGLVKNTSGFFPFLIVLPIMFVLGTRYMKKLVFDLVDEVWDDGDALVVKNGGQEQRIALSDIKNVNYSPMMSPPRVTLSLRHPTVFGDEIAFSAPTRVMPLTPSAEITDLIDRVDAARDKKS